MNKIYFYGKLGEFVNAEVKYNYHDYAITSEPIYTTDLTIMTGACYLGMDLELSSMLIFNIWGVCPKYCWKLTKLEPPQDISKGKIEVKTEMKLKQGIGIYLTENMPIYFCRDNNWMCVGDRNIKHYDSNIKFMNNAIMSLKDNEFKAIWIKLEKYV